MEFLNPFMLWGALAVSIPIIIHFWHQKKGQLLDWAATTWLIEKNLQQSRGIRLDNLLLLLLRCLLLLLLTFLLSKPLLNSLKNNELTKKIHLIQPNKRVVDNFKFEIEEAIKKGEKLYWATSSAEPLEDISKIPTNITFSPLGLQTCINQVFINNLGTGNKQFDIYFVNNQALTVVPTIFVPSKFALHTLIDSAGSSPKSYLEFSDQKKLFVTISNQLSSGISLESNGKFGSKAIHEGIINILIDNNNSERPSIESQTIRAALKSLAEVYQMELQVDEKSIPQKKYDWIFTNHLPIGTHFSSTILYIITNGDKMAKAQTSIQPNIVYVPFAINPRASDLVFNGELPEWLGEILVKFYRLKSPQTPLSYQQLHSLFKTQHFSKISEDEWLSKSILLAFIIILGIERWIALKKNA